MDIRKKLLSIVGVLALTMSMTAGIAAAQEDPTATAGDGIGVTFVVACNTGNAGISSASIGASDPTATSVAFPPYDAAAADQTGTVSTADNAFRITVNLSCLAQPAGFNLSANITDFKHNDDTTVTFPGSRFQISGTSAWTVTGSTAHADNILEPELPVEFVGSDGSYGSSALALMEGPTNASVFMDFTGQLIGLNNEILDGGYTAEITLTFSTVGGQP